MKVQVLGWISLRTTITANLPFSYFCRGCGNIEYGTCVVRYSLDKKLRSDHECRSTCNYRGTVPAEHLQYPYTLKEPGASQKHLFPPTSSSVHI